MSQRPFSSREVNRHHSDPSSSSRFYSNARYHRRGAGRGGTTTTARPNSGRSRGDDSESLTISIRQNPSRGSFRGRAFQPRQIHPSSFHSQENAATDEKWWRVSIPRAGSIGKEHVMSKLKANCIRQFQPYHYFIDRDTNMGIFFVNSRDEAEMLRRANRKIEVQNSETLSIMVSQTSTPAPILDEDSRRFFEDFIKNHRFNGQTFLLNLSNLAEDEELRSLGIYPQLNKAAFARDLVNIINANFSSTRQLDLGSNRISNLYEFRNLHLNNLEQLSLASNDLKSFEELNHLKQLTRLFHLVLKNNPLTSSNNKRVASQDELISAVRQRLPQLKRLDETDMPAEIGFGIDKEVVNLPRSNPFCVPAPLQDFLTKFIQEFYRLFDTNGRDGLHACYHDSCLFSLCIMPNDNSTVPMKQCKFGALIHDSRNLKKLYDENKRAKLLLHGKSSVLDFLRIKYPATKHEGSSFHVDVISTNNNRAIFSIVGLYREIDQRPNGFLRSFQRTFTCIQTATGVLIIGDHLNLMNVTEVQFQAATHVAPPPPPSTTTMTMESQDATAVENEKILQFSRESSMNYKYSKQCLAQNQWDYQKAAAAFLEMRNKNLIPAEAFQ